MKWLILFVYILFFPVVGFCAEPSPNDDFVEKWKNALGVFSASLTELCASHVAMIGTNNSTYNFIGDCGFSGVSGFWTTYNYYASKSWGSNSSSGYYFWASYKSTGALIKFYYSVSSYGYCPNTSTIEVIKDGDFTAKESLNCKCLDDEIYKDGMCVASGCTVNQYWDWNTETCKDKPNCANEDDFVKSSGLCVGCYSSYQGTLQSGQHTGWDEESKVCLLRDSLKVPIPGEPSWCPAGYELNVSTCIQTYSCLPEEKWNGVECVGCAEGEHLVTATQVCEKCDVGMTWNVEKQACEIPTAVCGGPGLPACAVSVQNACGGPGQPACNVNVVSGGSSGGGGSGGTCGGPGQPACEVSFADQGDPEPAWNPTRETGTFDVAAIESDITQAESDFQTAWNQLKTQISSVLSLNLAGSAQLPVFGPWTIMGQQRTIDLNVFASEMGWISMGILMISGIIALGVIFRK